MGAQKGRVIAHSDSPTYGFVILVPLKQDVGSPPWPFPQGSDAMWEKEDREREEATQEPTQAPQLGIQQDFSAAVIPIL